ncbi:MAG: hypothetical protein QOI95_3047 [Acidimicrobiaceae bacterium]|jgi:putative serine protease PepD
MGVCTLCGPERRPSPTPSVTSSSPTLITDAPPQPRPTLDPPRPTAPADRTQTLLAIGIALLIISLLASLFVVAKVTSLDSKLKDERSARAEAEARISTLEGSVKGVQDDQQSVHSQLEAQALADPTAISSRVQPSVYTVETPGGSLGSAWVVSSDHVTARFVTNYHVIADAWESGITGVSVFQDAGRTLDGTIEQALPDVDLALVAVAADIPALKQSNETPLPGETIVVIGSPLGFGGSVSTGTVSALRELNGIHLIQFAAPTSPGNSGGPIVNALGEVIGITELDLGRVIQGSENAKFAIPVNQVCISLKVC